MSKTEKTTYRIAMFALMGGGLLLLGFEVSWWASLALFMYSCGQNIENKFFRGN